MSLYSIVLFFHVGSALVLAAALGMEGMVLGRLRRVTSAREAEPWFGAWAPWTAGLSLLVLLLTGGYLTGRLAQWALAWPKAALVALVLIGAFGGITSKRMRLARKACSTGEQGDSECLRRLRDPLLKISVNMKIALLFAAVLLMTTNPGLYASWGIVAGGVLVGFLVSLPGISRGAPGHVLEAKRESRT
jgi:hypothetical protein